MLNYDLALEKNIFQLEKKALVLIMFMQVIYLVEYYNYVVNMFSNKNTV